MRKSKTRSGFRPLRVGIAATVTAAVVVAGTATSAFAAISGITPGVISGASGQTLTIAGSGMTADSAVFIPSSNGSCGTRANALSLPSASSLVSFTANATSATLLTPTLAAGSWKVCTYLASDGTGALLDNFSPITVVPSGTISPTSGPSAGTNSVSVSASGSPFVQGNDTVVFQNTGVCPAIGTPVANTQVAAADVRVINAGLLAFNVPTGVVTGAGRNVADNGVGDIYSLCAYDTSNTNALIAAVNAGYTVGATPTVSAISPVTAPAQGGGSITITGTLLTAATVTIGGTTVNRTNSGASSWVGTIPAHVAGGPFPIVLSVSNGGIKTVPAAFTYTNGIVVSPTTSPNTRARTDLDVQGVGFSTLTFGTTGGLTPNDNNAHVYLVKGNYDPTKNGNVKNVGQSTECLNVLAITDTELVCSLFLGGVPLSSGHAVTGTVSGTAFTATSGTFTFGDVNASVTGSANLAAGTAIASVIDTTHAVLTKAATTAITTATALTMNGSRTFSDAALTAGSPTIGSTATAQFNSADIGRAISGTGIPAGTTIAAVTSATSATLSVPATATASGAYTIANVGQVVPNGTYTVTLVNNGGLDVQPGGTNIVGPPFVKSIVSSGSTFTVADY